MSIDQKQHTIECCDSWCRVESMPTYSELTDLLRASVRALNQIPNKKLRDPHYPDTYTLARQIDLALAKTGEQQHG